MLRLWKWYQNCLATHPVKTQVISSGFIWGLGDIGAQAVTHSTVKPQKHVSRHFYYYYIVYLSNARISAWGFVLVILIWAFRSII